MPNVRRLPFEASKHRDFMSTLNEGGVSPESPPTHVFEFGYQGELLVFMNIGRLRMAYEYFSAKLRPSGAGSPPPFEHYWHPWFARLPKTLLKGSNRERIARALERALVEFGADPNSRSG